MPLQACPRGRPPGSQHRQHDARQEAVQPCPGRVINVLDEPVARRVDRRVVPPDRAAQHDAEDCHARADADEPGDGRPPRQPPCQQRKHQVEMLLHAQRPRLRKRLLARVVGQQVHAEGNELPAWLHLRRLAHPRRQRIQRQHHGVGRQDAPGAARVEPGERQRLALLQRPQYLAADQEPAEHEEDVHAHPAVTREPAEVRAKAAHDVRVEQHYPHDRDRAQQVQAGQAARRRTRAAPRAGGGAAKQRERGILHASGRTAQATSSSAGTSR